MIISLPRASIHAGARPEFVARLGNVLAACVVALLHPQPAGLLPIKQLARGAGACLDAFLAAEVAVAGAPSEWHQLPIVDQCRALAFMQRGSNFSICGWARVQGLLRGPAAAPRLITQVGRNPPALAPFACSVGCTGLWP